VENQTATVTHVARTPFSVGADDLYEGETLGEQLRGRLIVQLFNAAGSQKLHMDPAISTLRRVREQFRGSPADVREAGLVGEREGADRVDVTVGPVIQMSGRLLRLLFIWLHSPAGHRLPGAW